MSDKQYHPEEFFPALENLPDADQAVICGGQAVNLLAAVFLPEKQIESILGSKGSATSGDMDIVITKDLQAKICAAGQKSKGFSLQTFTDCRQPIQFVIKPDDLPDTRIDVLRSINGIHTVKDRVFEDAILLDNAPLGVMNPTTLLIGKAINCATLEQDSPKDKRNDIKHVHLLVPIVHNYLQELVEHCPPKKEDQRVIIGFLKRLHHASATATFKKGMKLAKVKFHDAIPIQAIRTSKLTTLQNYLEETFLKSTEPPGTL